MEIAKKARAILTVALLAFNVSFSSLAQSAPQNPQSQQTQPAQQQQYRVRVTSELVLVNVVVRDKKGNLVRDLKKDDFTLLEEGKRQAISTFDFENVDELATAGAAESTVSGTAPERGLLRSADQSGSLNARDRRLMLLFFDFSGMEPEDIERSVNAAKKFVQTRMQPADMIALVSLATNMRIDLDFSDDKTKVLSVLNSYTSGQGQGFDNGLTGSSEGAAETGGAFTADDTDYNTFNADRKLLALQAIMQSLGKISQKKAIIYFSNGISQNGVDNQSALRAATAAAVKANVSIYPVDIRGLQAFPPGGEAQSASLHGQSAYNGAAVLNDLSSNASTQDTLSTLASDTGGKAFFDSNDFGAVFSQVQKDSSAYYVLGFTSTNAQKDGKFRHLKVQLNRQDLKLDYRSGYYAGRDFEHLNRADREQQIQDELASELSQTDVSVYAGASYFRQDDSHYYLSVSLVIPGTQIPFVQAKDKDNATIDVIGEVRTGDGKFAVGHQRDTVKLAVDSAQQVRRKNVQYNTGFLLAPGSYHLKFVVRENQTGRMGSFETDVQIPDLRKTPLRMSSVVLSSQRVPAGTKKASGPHPLVQDQTELVPNVTHVFTQDQHLYLQYEVYDAARGKNPAAASGANGLANSAASANGGANSAATAATNGGANSAAAKGNANAASAEAAKTPPAKAPKDSVRVFTSIEFIQGSTKVYESKPIVANEVTAPDRKAVIFQIDLPLQSLKPGFYVCQVNVVDDVSGNFAFPRSPILVKEAVPQAASTAPTGK
ncbi:MAG: VWFA-related protein [Candidatus Acidoferrum typicum]|nr:VWFA-related protein [Candidatus Acidoferrum typicum]